VKECIYNDRWKIKKETDDIVEYYIDYKNICQKRREDMAFSIYGNEHNKISIFSFCF